MKKNEENMPGIYILRGIILFALILIAIKFGMDIFEIIQYIKNS
jgi:hypothetical protein